MAEMTEVARLDFKRVDVAIWSDGIQGVVVIEAPNLSQYLVIEPSPVGWNVRMVDDSQNAILGVMAEVGWRR